MYKKEWVVTMTQPLDLTCLINLSADWADFQGLTMTGYLLYSNIFLCLTIQIANFGGKGCRPPARHCASTPIESSPDNSRSGVLPLSPLD